MMEKHKDSNEYNSPIDHEKVDIFMNEVLKKHLLPNARYSSIRVMGPADVEKFPYVNMDLSQAYETLQKSKYYYNKPMRFIHFTSLKNLVSIIKEKRIRLYDLRAMDDKYEFNYAHKVFKKEQSSYMANRIKKQFFSLSMCKYDIEENYNSLQLWRHFGWDGHGAALVLTFEGRHKSSWYNYMISQIQYGDSNLKNIEAAINAYQKFVENHNFTIPDFEKLLYRILCFHKHGIYKDEKEVRLLYTNNEDSIFKGKPTKNIVQDVSSSGNLTSYFELPFEWGQFTGEKENYPERLKKIHPYIRIDKVIFGYRVSQIMRGNYTEVLLQYFKNYEKKPTIEKSSLYPQFI